MVIMVYSDLKTHTFRKHLFFSDLRDTRLYFKKESARLCMPF